MTTRDTPWPEGTPAWVDITVPDRKRAMDFYGPVLGWDFQVGSPEMGFYTQALVDGRPVGAIGEPQPGEGTPPAAWLTYLAADALEPVVERARQAGGAVLAEPFDLGEFGRMAMLADPTGAVFALWQAGTHTGFRLANEPGSVAWNEALTRDVDAAQAFYAATFGCSFGDLSSGDFQYATMDVDGRPVGGVGGLPADAPAEAPASWLTYFMVPDADATVAAVQQLGGALVDGPLDTEYGRMAVLTGPFGERFAIMGQMEQAAEGQ